ncbi:DUF1700 domain-containing protein [Oligoflexus tunisiensis]|uniref:DUF1700 domain-containing protein n=1 Tax=Oligoflexus tunisiensis TaxID=708132 RepID=UPI00159EF7BC|nr:DUF1700 domain-containing protein [Oligoflexus tunisiensis]
MQEHNFIKELERALRPLPATQREDVLADYRAHIFEARERGKSDEEIAAALGDPRTLGRTFVADYHLTRITNPIEGQKFTTSLYHMARASLVVLSILAFNFFFMLWPILALAFILGMSWVFAGVAVIVGLIFGIAVLIGNFAAPVTVGLSAKLALSFYSFSIFGASLLACVVLYLLSRWFLLGLMKYIKLNAKVIQPD